MKNVTTITSQKRAFYQTVPLHVTLIDTLSLLHFGGKHHQNLCHPEIKDRPKISNGFLKHSNHQLKINITAKRCYQSKIINFFFFGRLGCGWVGRDTGGIFNTGFKGVRA